MYRCVSLCVPWGVFRDTPMHRCIGPALVISRPILHPGRSWLRRRLITGLLANHFRPASRVTSKLSMKPTRYSVTRHHEPLSNNAVGKVRLTSLSDWSHYRVRPKSGGSATGKWSCVSGIRSGLDERLITLRLSKLATFPVRN